jgi:hypothetical protein
MKTSSTIAAHTCRRADRSDDRPVHSDWPKLVRDPRGKK